MEKEITQTEEIYKTTTYIDPQTNQEVPTSEVYFRGEGQPYKLEQDSEGNTVMTRKPLEQLKTEYTYPKD